ncbi:C-type lectin domain family 4 member M-like [Huso huso]|uniref:C-type lectin domain family 4 member M-like n=1 Tax=Huso huso TaxID=61971 RepID=A0ABR0Y8P8_HUSHU
MAQENIYRSISTIQHQIQRIRQESHVPAGAFGYGISCSDREKMCREFEIEEEPSHAKQRESKAVRDTWCTGNETKEKSGREELKTSS